MNFTLSTKTFLTIIYIVGIIGICSPFQYYFLLLSPLNLLITFWFLIKGYGKIEKGLGFSICLLVIITWIIEVVGVKSGQIFGPYYYGNALGLKILDTPPIIGMNWAMLLLSIGCILSSLKIKNRIFFSFIRRCIYDSFGYINRTRCYRPQFLEMANSKSSTTKLYRLVFGFVFAFFEFS
ncbi:MAG: carotenoid biosynthesis protein [Bacteroidetes bacterium]|nr:carotenoid biosynthesis protein [Bacteroidota bacterium]